LEKSPKLENLINTRVEIANIAGVSLDTVAGVSVGYKKAMV